VEVQQPATLGPRGLGRLLGSTGVSMVGQGAVAAAVPLLAATLTRDPFAVSLVTAATYAAWMVVGLPAGALVDRWPRRLTMVVADLSRAALLAGLSLAVLFDRLPLSALVVTVFLIASASCFFDPAAQAAIPVLAGREPTELAKANGRLWTLDILGRALLGPPLGAALFAVAAVLPLALNAFTFVMSAGLLLGLHALGRPVGANPDQRVAHAVRDGIRFLAKHSGLRLLTLGMATYNLGYNIAFATLVLFAQDKLGLSAQGFGILLAMLALGGILGGWLAPMVHVRLAPSRTYAACLGLQAVAWLGAALTENPWVSGGALVVIGLASTVVSVVGGTARQSLTPDHLLGRITAGTRVVGIGAGAVGALIGGLLGSAGTLTTPLVAAAVLLAVGCAAFAAVAPKQI
jgi:MFS family permease